MDTTKEKNPVGRPSKYNESLQEQADAYLYNWMERDSVPSRVGLCVWLGIAKSTSQEWERDYPEFSATLGAVETLQEYVAVNKGITNEFNSTIVKLILANHGYSDKQELSHTSPDGSMTPVTVVFGGDDGDGES